jgi:hypothetical protein
VIADEVAGAGKLELDAFVPAGTDGAPVAVVVTAQCHDYFPLQKETKSMIQP